MGTIFDLIQAYIKGDDGALETLYFKRGYGSFVFAKAYSIVRQPDKKNKARTVANDVFLDLRRKSLETRQAKFSGQTEKDFLNYLLSMAQFKAIDANRREKHVELTGTIIPEGQETPHNPGEDDEMEEKLKKVRECAEKNLSEPDNTFYELWLWHGFSEQKLMTHYQWSEKEIHTVKVRILRRLRKCLGLGK